MVAPIAGHLIVKTRLKFMLLEPFVGGSHREFARRRVSNTTTVLAAADRILFNSDERVVSNHELGFSFGEPNMKGITADGSLSIAFASIATDPGGGKQLLQLCPRCAAC